MGMTPVRIICTALAPQRLSRTTSRGDWYVRAAAGVEELPSCVTVLVDPSRPARYHVDLRSFGVPTSRLNWRSQTMTAAIMTVGIISAVFGTLAVGEGPAGLRPLRRGASWPPKVLASALGRSPRTLAGPARQKASTAYCSMMPARTTLSSR